MTWLCLNICISASERDIELKLSPKIKLPYSQKFSPGENFCLFRPGTSWAKFFSANYFTQWKFCHTEIFTRGCQAVLVVPHDHQSAVLPGIQNLFFLDLQPSLMSRRYCRTSTLHLRFARSCGTPIVGAIAFRHRRGQHCCEQRAAS